MNVRIRRTLAIGALVFASSTTLAEHGRTAGAFGVSPTGSATYSIPIWSPPGPNGVQPQIALSYNSQSGNGVAGVGWNFSGLSEIALCPRTLHQDGDTRAIELLGADGFCINGNRLRRVSGTYGAPGSVYHTEIADFSRITAYGTAGNGPQYFIVEAKNGLKYEYGNSASSRVTLGTTVFRWMLNKVSDRNGNNYAITYTSSNGTAVPSVIYWTPISFGSGTYRYQLEFEYFTTRPPVDSVTGQVVGNTIVDRNRIEAIRVRSAGAVVRKYRFGYQTSAATSRSLLSSAKECADDAETNCLLPIAFTYQAGFQGLTAGAGIAPAGSSNGLYIGRYDFNGDGKEDIAYRVGSTLHVALAANSGFTAPYNTGITQPDVLIDKFLPNGRAAIAVIVGGNLWIYRWNDATSAIVGASTGIATSLGVSLDYNGDRLADFVYTSIGSLRVRANTSTGSGAPSFQSSTTTVAQLPPDWTYNTIENYSDRGLYRADMNGDGREDMFAELIYTDRNDPNNTIWATQVLLGTGSGVALPPQPWVDTGGPWFFIDFNDDGCSDRVNGPFVELSSCTGTQTTSIATPALPLQLLDWDGDGRTDILVDNGGTFGVYRSTGSGFSSLISTTLASSGTYFNLDLDGDGIDDLIRLNGTSAISYWTHTASGAVPTYATNIPDLMSSVTDGFSVTSSVSYTSTSWSQYDNGAATNYPLQEQPSRIVVAKTTNSNGIGGTYDDTYFYVGSRIHSKRGKSVGFQRVDVSDSRDQVINRTHFEQDFPLSGMVTLSEMLQPNGSTLIARQDPSNTSATLDSTANNQRYFPYTASSVDTEYEVGGVWNGALLRTVSTANTFDNASGTLYDQTVTVTEPASGANGVTAGGSWSARTYRPLANLLNDTTNWCIGRPQQTQQINSSNLTYGAAITRTTNLVWSAVSCRPTQIVDEPGSGTLQVTTDFGYDSFGNVTSTIVTGIGMDPRETTSVYADATYTTGQFPLSVSRRATSTFFETTTATWNYDLGVPLSSVDPNALTTSWQYDAFGRRTRETFPDGHATTWSYVSCATFSGGCVGAQNKSVFVETLVSSLGTNINDLKTYTDALDRPIITSTRVLSGAYNRVDTEYDAIGNLYRQSAPCLWSSCSTYWTTNTYDLVSRLKTASRPISDSNPTLQTVTIDYDGLTTRVTDPQGKYSYKVVDAAGNLRNSKDHDNYSQTFDYDAFSGPKRVMDSAGNTLQTSTFNSRGMLTARTDLDMGSWSFTPNALGETASQTDAKSQSTTFTYDRLGRLIGRSELEGASSWTFGTSSASKNVGRVTNLSGPGGYSESLTYNAHARPVSRTITAAGSNYVYNYAYNTIGLLTQLTYPTSTSSYRLKLIYEYDYGHLKRIKDFNAPTTVFWTANDANPRNQLTQETLLNGLVTNRSYDAVTGWLKSIQTGMGGGTGVQNLAYEWDLVGNLKKRRDLNQSALTEDFFYDNLYRLDYSMRNSVQNLDLAYDALGNITTKSDVGNYTYHATKKHQVASTSNGWSFGYDANGNMTSGRGATLTWTSYNYPASITNGSLSSQFSYTPDREYWRQIATYADGTSTTIYAGGLLERVITPAGSDYRHLIRAGSSTIIVSRQSSGTNSFHYVTSDHLGSSSAITNASGGILVNSSFDAFGKRRGSNWTGLPTAGDWSAIASTTRRGYTEHSMLDNLTLIHMNGRVHDSMLGRFVSADPYIMDPEFTQNYNRYSYVHNNPLSYLDPSGFCDRPGQFTGTRLNGENVDGEGPKPDSNGNCPEIVVTGYPSQTDSMPEIEVRGRRFQPNVVDFFLHSSEHVAASFGDNSWTLAFWNVFAGGIAETANQTLEGDLSGATFTAVTIVIKPLKPLKSLKDDIAKAARGLGNPFKGKSASQIDEMFRKKGFEPRGPDPASGKGGYVNPETNRSYHIDEANSFGEPPHVDVNRLRTYDGDLPKKKYPFGD